MCSFTFFSYYAGAKIWCITFSHLKPKTISISNVLRTLQRCRVVVMYMRCAACTGRSLACLIASSFKSECYATRIVRIGLRRRRNASSPPSQNSIPPQLNNLYSLGYITMLYRSAYTVQHKLVKYCNLCECAVAFLYTCAGRTSICECGFVQLFVS